MHGQNYTSKMRLLGFMLENRKTVWHKRNASEVTAVNYGTETWLNTWNTDVLNC